VATDRQTAANRLNARKSTGPRSGGGKKRASRNSYRHGLATALVTTQYAKRVEKLARKIAGNATDFVILEHARNAAEAEFGLARIREVRVALIERMSAFGAFESPTPFNSLGTVEVLEPIDDAATMPSTESERLAEAVRRTLPELLKLDRYEQRAARLREQSLCAIYESKLAFT
jgi:hypothetical protein